MIRDQQDFTTLIWVFTFSGKGQIEISTTKRRRFLLAVRLSVSVTFAGGSPKLALNVREESKRPVGELTLDLAVGVEMEHIDALPTEPVSHNQPYDYFPEGHAQPSRLHMRYVVSGYPAERRLAILDIDYHVTLVESHRAKRPIELRFESSAYLCFSPVNFAVTGFVDCVITEECHITIEVVDIEGIRELCDRAIDLYSQHKSSQSAVGISKPRVYLKGLGVIRDRQIILAFLRIGNSPIVIELSISRLDLFVE